MSDTASRYHAALKSVVKRAILVLDAMMDTDMRFRSTSHVWARAIHDAAMAYGYSETVLRVTPTAREITQAEIVALWLTWLGKTCGRADVARLVAWAHDDPMWRIAEREHCSVRTVHYRIDRSIAAILKEFGGLTLPLPTVNEPLKRDTPAAFIAARPIAGEVGIRAGSLGKVWIDGIGFMRDGSKIYHAN